MEWDDFGKKILHAICGAILGFVIGFGMGSRYLRYSLNHLLIFAGAVSLILGFIAFRYTDEFWNNFGRR